MTVYLDHNSTTPMRPEAHELLLELLERGLGNASSVHASGRAARAVVDEARERVAAALDVPEEWIVFTSGGTEANHAALCGALAAAPPGAGLVVGSTEHPSVLRAAEDLAAQGRSLGRAPVDDRGVLWTEACVEMAGRADCALLSTMLANNEVGALLPAEELAGALGELGESRPVWHVDAVQALGRVELDLLGWGVDLASLSAHKVGGPLGVGVLIRNPKAPWSPWMAGGGQEGGARGGTENAPGIGAAALAIELAQRERPRFVEQAREQVARLWAGLRDALPLGVVGPPVQAPRRLCNTLCVRAPGVSGHALVARLDLEGLQASVGSACSSGALEPSHVLLAMGVDASAASSALRLSVGRETTHKDIHSAVDTLVTTLRPLIVTP